MSPEDLTSKVQHSSVVGFHKFVLLHGRHKTDLFCFFEGRDTHYYFPRVLQFYGEDHHPIICGNKRAVIKTAELIISKYKSSKTAFFIDSDYDDNSGLDQIYCTPCYSIENLYCTSTVLSRILKNEFMLSVLDPEYRLIMELFESDQKKYHEAATLFNTWYATAKHKAKKNNVIVNVSLNEKLPKDFVSIKIGDINAHYNLESIVQKFPDAIQISEDEIKEYCAQYDFTDPTMKFRGKYEIEFFYIFLRYIIDDANKGKKILKKKTKFNIDSSQILSQLSQYSETPNCLVNYLRQFRRQPV